MVLCTKSLVLDSLVLQTVPTNKYSQNKQINHHQENKNYISNGVVFSFIIRTMKLLQITTIENIFLALNS